MSNIVSYFRNVFEIQLTQVYSNVYLGLVRPYIVPDVVCQKLRETATICGGLSGEDSIDIRQPSTVMGCEVVSLVQIDAHRVDGGKPDDFR